jgi:hypothetical protein
MEVLHMDKAVNLIVILSSLIKLFEGSVLNSQDYEKLKLIMLELGYTEDKLTDVPIVTLLKEVCKDFSEVEL